MDTKENIEIRLWDYIDGNISAEEKNIIKNLLEYNVDWQQAYKEILNLQQILTSSELEQPSLRFTKNVMDSISNYTVAPAANYINKKIIWAIGLLFITLIAVCLIYAFAQINWSTPARNSYFDFKSIDFNKFFSSSYTSIFLMANIVAALMFLDRYLAGKKNKLRHQA